MNRSQAIAALRRIHKGGFHEHGDFRVDVRKTTVRAKDRAEARAKMNAMRDLTTGQMPRTPEVKELRSIALTYRVRVGVVQTGPLPFFLILGQGDTIAEAVVKAERSREADLKRWAKAKKEARKGER